MEKPWYKSYVKGVAYTLQYEKITMPQALTRSVNQFNNSESSFLITLDLLGPRMIALKPKTPIKHIVVAHIRDHLRNSGSVSG